MADRIGTRWGALILKTLKGSKAGALICRGHGENHEISGSNSGACQIAQTHQLRILDLVHGDGETGERRQEKLHFSFQEEQG